VELVHREKVVESDNIHSSAGEAKVEESFVVKILYDDEQEFSGKVR
jgi:hypothetical protein